MEKVTVLGLGSMAAALTILLHNNGHSVTMWGRPEEAARVGAARRSDFMPGVKLPDGVIVTADIREAAEPGVIVFAVPSGAVREAAEKFRPYLTERHLLINAAKGIEEGSLKRLSEVLRGAAPMCAAAVLMGPGHAEEIAVSLPTTYVAASGDMAVSRRVQDIFMSPVFRVYTNSDLIGVEMGGAVKNVIALAAGISDGLGFGDNAKAALVTRGLNEISRLGVAMGADALTFAGLSGVGDLIVTCTSMHSRNRRCGILLGRGKPLDEALAEVKAVVEGAYAAKSALALARKYSVEMPIVEGVNEILFNGKPAKQVVVDLMTRDKKTETI